MLQTISSPDTIEIKYLTKTLIEEINARGISEDRKIVIKQDCITSMNEETYFPIQNHYESDTGVRVQFVLNSKGDTVPFDLSFDEWNSLPSRNISKPA